MKIRRIIEITLPDGAVKRDGRPLTDDQAIDVAIAAITGDLAWSLKDGEKILGTPALCVVSKPAPERGEA